MKEMYKQPSTTNKSIIVILLRFFMVLIARQDP